MRSYNNYTGHINEEYERGYRAGRRAALKESANEDLTREKVESILKPFVGGNI